MSYRVYHLTQGTQGRHWHHQIVESWAKVDALITEWEARGYKVKVLNLTNDQIVYWSPT